MYWTIYNFNNVLFLCFQKKTDGPRNRIPDTIFTEILFPLSHLDYSSWPFITNIYFYYFFDFASFNYAHWMDRVLFISNYRYNDFGLFCDLFSYQPLFRPFGT